MKTAIALIATLFMVSTASAAKLVQLTTFKDAGLQQSFDAVFDTDLSVRAFKVVKPSAAKGRPADIVRMQTVAQAAHLLCGFFEDGVDLGQATSVKEAVESLEVQDWDDLETKLSKGLSNVSSNVEFYYGGASGNNTSGNVLGAYDVANDQILVMANTNCGSDD